MTLTLSLLDTYDKLLLQQQQETAQPQTTTTSAASSAGDGGAVGSNSGRKARGRRSGGIDASPARAGAKRPSGVHLGAASLSHRPSTQRASIRADGRAGQSEHAAAAGSTPKRPGGAQSQVPLVSGISMSNTQQHVVAPPPLSPRSVHFAPELVVPSEALRLSNADASSPQHRVASPVRSSLRGAQPLTAGGPPADGSEGREGSDVYAPPEEDDNAAGSRSPSPSAPPMVSGRDQGLPSDAAAVAPPSTWERLTHRPRYEAVLASLKQEASKKLNAVCTFQPKVNARSRALAKAAVATRIKPWARPTQPAPHATPGAPVPEAPTGRVDGPADGREDGGQILPSDMPPPIHRHHAFHHDPLLEDRGGDGFDDSASDASNRGERERQDNGSAMEMQLLRRRNRSMSSLHLGSFFSKHQVPGTPSDVSPSSRHGSMMERRQSSLLKSPTITRFPSRGSLRASTSPTLLASTTPRPQSSAGPRRSDAAQHASEAGGDEEAPNRRVLSDLFIWEAHRKEKLAALAAKVHAERQQKASAKEAEWRAITPIRMSPATRRIVEASSDRRINAVDHAAMVAAANAHGIAKQRRKRSATSALHPSDHSGAHGRGRGGHGDAGCPPLTVSLDWFLEQAHADPAYARNA